MINITGMSVVITEVSFQLTTNANTNDDINREMSCTTLDILKPIPVSMTCTPLEKWKKISKCDEDIVLGQTGKYKYDNEFAKRLWGTIFVGEIWWLKM